MGVSFHSFAKPLQKELIDLGKIGQGIEPVTPGGLFVASYGDQEVSLVVGTRKVDGGFGGLLIEPQFPTAPRSKELAFAIVKAIISWSDARLAGALATDRRARVVMRLKEYLYGVMCGPNWADAERDLRLGSSSDLAIEALIQCFERKRAFAVVLARDAVKYARYVDHVRQREFACLAQRYAVAPGVASKPALDLYAVLMSGRRPSDADLMAMIDHLWDHPALTAGARLIQLLGQTDGYDAKIAGSSA
jgi:hypothetical protein